jgi:hypothetical protein
MADAASVVKFGHLVNVKVIGKGVGDPVDKFVPPPVAVVDEAITAFDQRPLPELAGQVKGTVKPVMGHRWFRWQEPPGEAETYRAFLPFHEVKSMLWEQPWLSVPSMWRSSGSS